MSTDTNNTNTNQDTNNDINNTPQLNNDELQYDDTYKPWTNVIRGRCTCTANIYGIQKQLIEENITPINSEDVANALHNKNLLRQTRVIQISSNIKYVSITFTTSIIMETFCSEPLQIQDFSVKFTPDFRKRNRITREHHFISFLNVPSEADEEHMTDFVKQHATVVGDPRYPTKTVHGIDFLTGTRIYRVHSISKHIPRLINLFGRQIKCIYTAQPEYQEQLERKRREREHNNQQNNQQQNNNDDTTSNTISDDEHQWENNSDSNSSVDTTESIQNNTNHIANQIEFRQTENEQEQNVQTENESPHNKEETQIPTPQQTRKRQVNQHIPNNTENITRRKQKTKNTNNSKRQIETSPPELTDNNYPPLQKNQKENQEIQQPQDQQNKTTIEETPLNEQPQPEPTIIEETPISQQLIDTDTPLDFLSPPLATNKMTTTTPDTINTSTPEIQAPTTKIPQSTKNYIYNKNIMQPEIMNKQGKIIPQEKMQDVALKMTEKLARSNYRDTGFLSNAIRDEKNRIIALSMYYQIGRFDPSNTFIKNYSNKDVLRLVRSYTEKKLLKTNALVQIFTYINQIEKRMELTKSKQTPS